MPLIPVIGRKQPKMRLLIAVLYTLLSLGAVTMVYPFVVMIATSVTSPVDRDEFRPVPAYLSNDTWLYRKYIEAKYNEDIQKFNAALSNEVATFKDLTVPRGVTAAGASRRVEEWLAFRSNVPESHWMLGGATNLSRITPEMVGRYRVFLQRRYRTVEAVNAAYRQTYATWEEVRPPLQKWDDRTYQPTPSREYREFLEFKAQQPARYRITVSGDGLFQDWLRLKYGATPEKLNAAWGTSYKSRFEVRLPLRAPAHPAQRADWLKFVRSELPAQFIAADPAAAALYRRFLAQRYPDPAVFRKRYAGTPLALHAASKTAQSTITAPSLWGVPAADWMEFVQTAPAELLSVRTPDVEYREHLQRKYGTTPALMAAVGPMTRSWLDPKVVYRESARSLASLNAAYGTTYRSWQEPTPPYLDADWVEMQRDRGPIKREFLVRNYREVLNYIALHGPAVWNTFVLCAGLLLATLIINPLCAYALSRYNLPATYKILLFLLATMAFPAEVSAIPNFLLLKQLHLLNTYWALILPAMANGYSIFLLKGFFDSLPKELYEAGTIDGASEARMFSTITLPMSTPVLAVIALGTFTAAYGSFLWAFLVCQDPSKWTLMVWLSQMQSWAPMSVIFAALVLAAIPTLLVFIFCQNIIMRGIIVPTEK
jgi:ABC-type glycerol-3-phosphate transport system permease component